MKHATGILLLMALFAVAIVIVDPRGDMPLNDDWNFAMSAWHFADTGEIRFARFTGMSLRAQVIWGALWTELFGKSFEVLRASTLFLAAATIVLLYFLLNRIAQRRSTSLLLTTVLLFSPMFFWCAFTFMTHVPYVFLSIASFYLAFRAVAEKRFGFFVAAAVVALTSCFIRQTGLANFVPLVAAVGAAWETLPDRRRWLAASLLPFFVFAALYLGTGLLHGYPGQIEEHFEIWQGGPLHDLVAAVQLAYHYVTWNLEYAFLFFLPVAVLAFAALRERKTMITALIAAPLIAMNAAFQVGLGRALPYPVKGNVFSNFALGPLTLRDTWVWGLGYVTTLPTWLRVILTFGAAAGATALLAFLVRLATAAFRERDGSESRIALSMAVAHIAASTALLFASGIYFDRYSLDSTWALLVVFASWRPEEVARHRLAIGAGVALMAVLSIAGTAEYLEWNRARWRAFEFLRGRGVTLEEMDGGYEINQYLLGGWEGQRKLQSSGMSVISDRFVLTFKPVFGCRTLARFPYRRLLGADGAVYAIEKLPEFHPWDALQHQSE